MMRGPGPVRTWEAWSKVILVTPRVEVRGTTDQETVRRLDGEEAERVFTDKASGKDSAMATLPLSAMCAFAEFERA